MTNALARRDTATNAGDMALCGPTATDARLIDMWLGSGKRANSPATQSSYRRTANKFLASVGKPLQWITLPDLQAWRESLTGSESTKRTHIATVRSLFAHAQKTGYIRLNPAVMLEAPAVPQAVHRRVLKVEDVRKIVDACQTPQETALVRVLYNSGARVSEALSLTWQDVTPRSEETGGAVLKIVDGKGHKPRDAGINKDTYAALVALRHESTPDTAYVFATRSGHALDRHAAHKLLKRVLLRAGVKVDKDSQSSSVSAHWLRHSHATHAVAAGASVTDVQAQLGHASLATTTIYVQASAYSADSLAL